MEHLKTNGIFILEENIFEKEQEINVKIQVNDYKIS